MQLFIYYFASKCKKTEIIMIEGCNNNINEKNGNNNNINEKNGNNNTIKLYSSGYK